MTVTINALDAQEDTMPTAAWFEALPEDRKTKAIQGSYLWKLAHDDERLWGKLGPCADHSEELMVNRKNTEVDPTVAQMLDQVPDMLMDGFILMASSALLDSLELMAKVLRKYAPEVISELTSEHERLEPYVTDAVTKRTTAGRDRATGALNAESNRARLWVALQDTRARDPEATAEIDRAWRLNARAEFLLREMLKATAGDY